MHGSELFDPDLRARSLAVAVVAIAMQGTPNGAGKR